MTIDLTLPAFVYVITCLVTGKEYIGVTVKTLEWRMKQHIKEAKACRFDTVFYRAMRIHGVENFRIEVIVRVSSGLEAQMMERRLIVERNTLAPNGLNTSTGGESYAGIMRTQEVRDKISAAKKGTKMSASARENMSAARRGRPVSDAQVAGLLARNADPAVRAELGRQSRVRWAEPEYAGRQRILLAANRASPEFQERRRAGVQRAKQEGKYFWREKKEPKPRRTKHEAMLARWEDPDYRARMAEKLRQHVTPESEKDRLRALAAGQRGKPISADHRAAISVAMTGKKRAPYKYKDAASREVRLLAKGLDATIYPRPHEMVTV